MIDLGQPRLSIEPECALLTIRRLPFYRERTPDRVANLVLMRLIAEQFLETPCVRYAADGAASTAQRPSAGRHRVRRLMSRVGLAPIYPRPKTTQPHLRHKI